MDAPSLPEHDLSRPVNGQIATWAQVVVLAAAVATLAIAFLVPRLVLDVDSPLLGLHPGIRYGLAGLVAIAMLVAVLAPARVSLATRVAIALPLAHLAVMAVAAFGWFALSQHLTSARDLVPLVEAVPLGVIVGGVAATIVLASCVIARRRRREVIQVAVTIALVELLLLGLWLPIASAVAAPRSGWATNAELFGSPVSLVAFAVVPPLVGAVVYGAIATRRPRWLDKARPTLLGVLTLAFLAACSARLDARANPLTIYLNFVPWLLAAALVAVTAIAALCVSYLFAAVQHRRSISPERREATGVAVGDRTIGRAMIRSWLRGPEIVVQAFEVETRDGTIPVPPGATLATSLPLSTSVLRVGEGAPVLEHGATVGLGGFDRASDGAPFRRSLAPSAGERLIVGTEDDGARALDQVALAAWRPCIAYLVIFTLAALPALAGLHAI